MPRQDITIEGLDAFQTEILDEIWKMNSEEEYVTWFELQDPYVQKEAFVLMQLLSLEIMETNLDKYQDQAQQEIKKIIEGA